MAGKTYTFTDYSLPYYEHKDNNYFNQLVHKAGTTEEWEVVPAKPATNKFVAALIEESQKSLTENSSPTFSSSGSKTLDFLFQVLENTSKERLIELLQDSWKVDPEVTLKLIAHLRDIKGGKSIRSHSYVCMYWLYEHHPKTLYMNLENFAAVGYFKDLLNLMMVVAFKGYMGDYMDIDDHKKKPSKRRELVNKKKQNIKKNIVSVKMYISLMSGIPMSIPIQLRKEKDYRKRAIYPDHEGKVNKRRRMPVKDTTSKESLVEVKTMSDEELAKTMSNVSLDVREHGEIKDLRRKFAKDLYATDLKYRAFLNKVADIFVRGLIEDQKNSGDTKNRLLFAAKWAPSNNGHYDKYLHISSLIAIKLKELTENGFVNDGEKDFILFAHLAREDYRKMYAKLRALSHLAETHVTTEEFEKINYKRVPSKAFQMYKSLFIQKDEKRFKEFIETSKKVGGTSLKPVEIVTEILKEYQTKLREEITQKQWNSLVENMGKSKLIANTISVCDVSGSMDGQPMMAAIGLTLLTCELSNPPWNTICISFAEAPQIYDFSTKETISERVKHIMECPWGGNTNFNATMDLILKIGVEKKLTQQEMPEVIFVFTDMEFDSAFPGTSKTNFETVKEAFEKEGYVLPIMVFWNLRGTKSTPVKEGENGVMLLSGFSDKTLKGLLKDGLESITPQKTLEKIVQKYSQFKTFD